MFLGLLGFQHRLPTAFLSQGVLVFLYFLTFSYVPQPNLMISWFYASLWRSHRFRETQYFKPLFLARFFVIRVRISVVLINSIGGMKQIMKQEYNMIDPYIYIHIHPYTFIYNRYLGSHMRIPSSKVNICQLDTILWYKVDGKSIWGVSDLYILL